MQPTAAATLKLKPVHQTNQKPPPREKGSTHGDQRLAGCSRLCPKASALRAAFLLPAQQARAEDGASERAQQDRAAIPDGDKRQRIGGAMQGVAGGA